MSHHQWALATCEIYHIAKDKLSYFFSTSVRLRDRTRDTICLSFYDIFHMWPTSIGDLTRYSGVLVRCVGFDVRVSNIYVAKRSPHCAYRSPNSLTVRRHQCIWFYIKKWMPFWDPVFKDGWRGFTWPYVTSMFSYTAMLDPFLRSRSSTVCVCCQELPFVPSVNEPW